MSDKKCVHVLHMSLVSLLRLTSEIYTPSDTVLFDKNIWPSATNFPHHVSSDSEQADILH